VVQDRVQWRTRVNTAINSGFPSKEFFQQLWTAAGFLIKTMLHAFRTVGARSTDGSSAQTSPPEVLTSLFSLQVMIMHMHNDLKQPTVS
jgi:hypothetical protein